jgi:hypothetical protein
MRPKQGSAACSVTTRARLYPADLVKRLHDILWVSAQPVDVRHFILDSLHALSCAEQFLEPFTCRVQLVFDSTLQFRINGGLLFLKFLPKRGYLEEIVWRLEVLPYSLSCVGRRWH